MPFKKPCRDAWRNRPVAIMSRGGNNGKIILNRINSATSPTGQFCCVVPDATDVNQTHCINISEE